MTAEHGTDGRYNNQKCRCEECRYAHAQVHREYMRRQRRLALLGKAVLADVARLSDEGGRT